MKKYVKEFHFQMINAWMKRRGLNSIYSSHLPPTGLIVEDVACGFLIKCNNNTAILDFYVSNPYATKEDRDKALDQITHELLSFAQKHKLRAVFGNTNVKATFDRSEKHGFKCLGDYKVIVKEF